MSTKYLISKKCLFAATLLFSFICPAMSEVDSMDEAEAFKRDCSDCCNELNLRRLCVDRLKARCAEIKKLNATTINVDDIHAKTLCLETEFSTNEISGTNINGQNVCAENLTATTACVGSLVANDVCIPGALTVSNFKPCAKYAATVIFNNDTPYNLGSTIGFDTILSDPNNNVTLAPGFMSYTAPFTGDYVITVQIDQHGLNGSNVIVGLPVTNIELYVNGTITRQTFVPYLSFHDAQKGNYSALIGLQAGDVITSQYNVFVMNDTAGFVPYAGQITIEGNPGVENASLFKIHLLSIACPNGVPCSPCTTGCQPTVTGCQPFSTGCQPSGTGVCKPCFS